MRRREQVLLTNWLSEWFHYCAKKYDMSYSELIRITLCLQIRDWIKRQYPKYKFNFSQNQLTKELNRLVKGEGSESKVHEYLSTLYFEARKAIDFLMAQEPKNHKR